MDFKLNNLQETLLKAIEVAGAAIVITDVLHPEKPVVYCNDAFVKITGYSKEEIVGRNCEFLQNDDTEQEELNNLRMAIKEGKDCKVVLRNYKKDGTLFYNELSINPICNNHQQITHYIGVQKDVTLREKQEHVLSKLKDTLQKTLEEKIKVHNEELTATVQKLVETNLMLEQQVKETKIAEHEAKTSFAILDGIIENFPKGVILVFNDKFQVVYAEGEEIHTNIFKEFELYKGVYIDDIKGSTQETKDGFKEHIQKTLDGVHLSYEINFAGFDYSVNTIRLPETYTMEKQALLVYQNITEQKKLEIGIKNALIKERELNELKSRFIATASHEFRTPLSAINMCATLIETLNAPDKAEKRLDYVNRIKSNVKNLVVILDDFLSLSKIEEGGFTSNPVHFDLINFSKTCIEELRDTRKEGQIILFNETIKNHNVYFDPKLLHHVLQNLLSNAIKYSEKHKVITLALSEENKHLYIEVTDQGIGIPEDEHAFLFQRFFRAANVTHIEGTGLGLNIVKQYTELMGGTIGFKSTMNEGSTFKLTFPILEK